MKAFVEQLVGTEVQKVTLENKSGMLVELLSVGAGITRVAVKNPDGSYDILTESFADYVEYIDNNTAYVGKTLGPNAGRFYVSKGINLPDGSVIRPEANEKGTKTLHGSSKCLSVDNWKLEKTEADAEKATAVFTALQPDGLCDWPGNRKYTVEYILSEDNALTIKLGAETDAPTYINMSNHAYWNLNLDVNRAMEQILTVNATGVVFNDVEHIPEKIVSIEEIKLTSGVDYSKPNKLKEVIITEGDSEYAGQIRLGNGLNNAFVFGEHSISDCLCSISDSEEKHTLKMYSDAPAMVAYSSGSMDENLELLNGQLSKKSCSIAFEFQEVPSVCEAPEITTPEKSFSRTIIYKVCR